MGDAHHCSGPPVSEMTYTVSSGTLNPSIPYHSIKMHLLVAERSVRCDKMLYSACVCSALSYWRRHRAAGMLAFFAEGGSLPSPPPYFITSVNQSSPRHACAAQIINRCRSGTSPRTNRAPSVRRRRCRRRRRSLLVRYIRMSRLIDRCRKPALSRPPASARRQLPAAASRQRGPPGRQPAVAVCIVCVNRTSLFCRSLHRWRQHDFG